jgi:pilus assembly protein CpaB
VLLVGAFFYFRPKLPGGTQGASLTQTAAAQKFVQVISASQPIAPGTKITEAMLGSYQMPEENLVQGLFTDARDVIGMYAKVSIPQGAPITATELASTAGNINLPGSNWANFIPQGLTAISIPISRLSSASFAIRDGDYVNVIVSIALVDVDPADQTILPDKVGGYSAQNQVISGFSPADISVGFYQVEEIPNAIDYIYPAEDQRPRMVTQMIMQNVQVLHVGSFPLPGQPNSDSLNPQLVPTPVATPQANNQGQAAIVTVVKPDVITLMVSPQDAVTLTYLIYSKAEVTLTLRNPSDQEAGAQPDAAMLEYLLTQYNIPVPAKLPYSTNPRLDILEQPTLTNDLSTP